MDFQGLESALTHTGTTVTIGTDTLPGAFPDFLRKYYVGQGRELQIDNAEVMLDEPNRAVKIAGRANFLRVANLPVRATLSVDAQGRVDAVITYTLIDRGGSATAWRFSTSFPEIPAGAASSADGSTIPHLDLLTFTEAYFVVATRPYTDASMHAEIGEGVSFLGKVMPLGLVGPVDDILAGIQSIPIYGQIRVPADETELPTKVAGKDLSVERTFPWEIQPAVYGIHLEAPLGKDFSVGKLQIRDARFRIFSPLSWSYVAADEVYEPLTAVTGRMDIPSAGISVEVITTAGTEVKSVSRASATAFVEARCKGLSLGNLAHLADIAGSGDLTAHLPDELSGPVRALEKLSLLDLSLVLSAGTQGLSLKSMSVGIGIPQCRWRVWGDHVEVTDLGFRLGVANPLGIGGAPSVFTDVWGTSVIEGVPFQIKATKYSGGVVMVGRLKGKETLPLKQLMKSYLPAVPPPADLTIDDMEVSVDPGAFQISGALAQKPESWKLALGPGKLEISDVVFDLVVPRTGGTKGMFRGNIGLGKGVSLAMAYSTPGNFVIRADVDEVRLGHLIGTLANQKVFLPSGFDITLLDSSVLIEENSGSLRFQLATRVDGMGCLAFEARQVGGLWGFAAGLDLGASKSSSLPGMAALAAFEKMAHLEKLALIVASYDNAEFQFPDMAQFQNHLIGTGKVALPSQSGGLRAGFNIFGEWRVDTKDKMQYLLSKLLGVDGTLDTTLQVGEDTIKMFVRRDAKLMGHPMFCEFGLQASYGVGVVPVPAWFLTGAVTVNIQGHPQEFDVTMASVPTGAFLAATMKGSAPVDVGLFKLQNLSLEVGVNWAGIPSLGIVGTIDVKKFESSIAVFFDSTNPCYSMFAGSISDVSLKDVSDALLGGAVPSAIDDVLATVSIKGTHQFKIPGDLADELDNRDFSKISAAFMSGGKLQIPASSDQATLCVNKKGSAWHLTDMTKMRHYALNKRGNDIVVTTEAQFYFAPQPTMVGTIRFPQGAYLAAAIDFFGFKAQATIELVGKKGFSIDAQMDKIVIGNENVFAITAAEGAGGPKVSISNLIRPEDPVKEYRLPHFYVNGRARLLGLEVVAFASVSIKGIALEIKGPLAPGVTFDLDAQLGGTDLVVDGDILVGIGTIDLGELGKIKVNTDVEGSLGVRVNAQKVEIAVEGSFEFLGNDVDIGRFPLDPEPNALAKMAKKMEKKVEEELRKIFSDAGHWANAVGAGLVSGVEDTEKVFKNVYKKSEKEAKDLAKGVNKGANAVGKEVDKDVKKVGDEAKKFGKKLKKIF